MDTASGTEAVWWKRNLPFCGFRDYVFGRRVWRDGDAFYTITKGAEHSARPRGANPRVLRVEPYLSAWLIRPVPGYEKLPDTHTHHTHTHTHLLRNAAHVPLPVSATSVSTFHI